MEFVGEIIQGLIVLMRHGVVLDLQRAAWSVTMFHVLGFIWLCLGAIETGNQLSGLTVANVNTM